MQTEPTVDTQPLNAEPEQAPKVRLGSSSAYQFAAQVLTLGTSFVASVLIARALGPVGKGQLSVLQQVPGTLLVLLNLGIGAANTYFVGSGRMKSGTALGNSLAFALFAGLIGLPFTWLMTTGPWSVVNGLSSGAAALAYLTLPLGLAGSYVAAIGIGVGRVKYTSMAQMVGGLTSTAVVVLAYLSGRPSVMAAIGAGLLSLVLALVVNVAAIRGCLTRVTVSRQAFKDSALYSIKAYLSNLAGYLNYRQDILLVGYLAGAAAVGIYSISVTFAELMWYVPNSIATALLAKSLTSEQGEAYRLSSQTSRIVSVLMLVIVVAAAVLIVPVIRLFYGEQFVGAAASFLILLPGAWLLGVGKVLGAYLGSRGYQYPAVSVIAAVGNLVLNLLLIPLIGFKGAAVASTISYTYLGLRTAMYFKQDTGAKWSELFIPNADDWRTVRESASGYRERLMKR